MKHWAHVISEDLVKWEWSDQMLIPDQEYEKKWMLFRKFHRSRW